VTPVQQRTRRSLKIGRAPPSRWSQLPHFPSRNFLPFRVAREEKSPMSPNRSAVYFGSSSRFAMFSSNPCPLGVPDRVLRRRVVLGGAEGGRWGAADWSWAARGGGFRPGPERRPSRSWAARGGAIRLVRARREETASGSPTRVPTRCLGLSRAYTGEGLVAVWFHPMY
jgi:hypothetical protein